MKNQTYQKQIHTFNSNYTLYHNLNQKIIITLKKITPQIKQYNINKIFLNLTNINNYKKLKHFNHHLKTHILNTIK
ncbi:DNA polymerase V subunit UmuC, partial [Bacillus thuringiensis]|nr:DNA polymerase V subunit UmuC [Bacillus thuringiensis]